VIQFYINYFNRPSKIPGPLPIPIFGNLLQLGDFPAATKTFHEKYGDLYEFYMGSIRIVMISRPDLVEKVWGATSLKTTKFIMRNSYSEGIDELGLGTKGMVLNRNIEVWAINRKFMNVISTPAFLRESIKLSSKTIDEIFGYWKIMEKNGLKIDFSKWSDALGADIVGTTTIGKRMTSAAELFNELNIVNEESTIKGTWQNSTKFVHAIHLYNKSMSFMMLFPKNFRRIAPGFKSSNKTFLDNKEWIDQELDRVVSEKRKEIENTPLDQPLESNILTLLLTTNTERDLDKISAGKFDRPLTDDEAKSIIREVFTGGLDTTSNTLAFVIFYIAKHRNVYLKMREEVLDVYGTLENPDLSIESYGKLKYIEAVINETIRIFPTVFAMPRASTEDVEFDGFTIKADTTVYTDYRAISNDPKYFKNPEIFNPDRFLNDKESIIRYTYLPFGNGVRACPGRAWAMAQMKTFLVKLVSSGVDIFVAQLLYGCGTTIATRCSTSDVLS
ncbi:20096_t:CDS:2, partial [Dentiscutata erythropus]